VTVTFFLLDPRHSKIVTVTDSVTDSGGKILFRPSGAAGALDEPDVAGESSGGLACDRSGLHFDRVEKPAVRTISVDRLGDESAGAAIDPYAHHHVLNLVRVAEVGDAPDHRADDVAVAADAGRVEEIAGKQ
jgi:hypothetical protein